MQYLQQVNAEANNEENAPKMIMIDGPMHQGNNLLFIKINVSHTPKN